MKIDSKSETSASVDANALATYLHTKAEIEKVDLARDLHDNLGGLIVAALMDAAWVQEHLADTEDAQRKLQRIKHSLGAAIDLKRKLIEELRPTLLDTFGLFAAMKWHLKHCCAHVKAQCTEIFPDEEPSFTSESSIALFRFFQEALHLIVVAGGARSVALDVELEDKHLLLRFTHNTQSANHGDGDSAPEFLSMNHRVTGLGGELHITPSPDGHSLWSVAVPLDSLSKRAA